ncbi:helix-turn-helix transcriptional regulator [Tannerella forsythia]|uniref:S24 family peptidase n=1 Tax=Tannerella forsythia TaxID=28112 RepID=UPI0028EE083E|nr:S24 family peptidase [Tannerella forsythia]
MITERIKHLIETKGITKYKFCKDLGFSNGFLDKPREISTDKYANILEYFPDVNPEWLLTGQGPMLKDKERAEIAHAIPTEETKGIPLIPIGAMAGYANGDVQVMDYEITHHYNIPDFENRGVKFMIRASGSSMYPKYSNGDILACRPITDLSFFQWGKVYVLDTDQGPLVKRLFPCPDNDEYLECHSDNKTNYPPFPIRKSSIRKVAIVVGVIRLE